MDRTAVMIGLIIFSLIVVACSPKITPGEEKVLVALREIQRGAEADIDYEGFVGLLSTAQTKIDSIKNNAEQNGCFLGAVKKCYASYEIVHKAWKKKMQAKDQKRKEELDMALSFALSFAALNIKKAADCYK